MKGKWPNYFTREGTGTVWLGSVIQIYNPASEVLLWEVYLNNTLKLFKKVSSLILHLKRDKVQPTICNLFGLEILRAFSEANKQWHDT